MKTLIIISDRDDQQSLVKVDSDNTSPGATRILLERFRVMDHLLRTAEHDSQYENGELVLAAAAYLCGPGPTAHEDGTPFCWPWDNATYHGGQDRVADLVRAGQFIAAEIDRLLLLAENGRNPDHPPNSPSEGESLSGGLKLANFRSDGTRLDANPDTQTPTAKVFEPGTGSDPTTWFGGALAPVTDPARPDSLPD